MKVFAYILPALFQRMRKEKRGNELNISSYKQNMKKIELQEMSDVSDFSIAKIGRCENVTTDVPLWICKTFDCNIKDIVERISIDC